MALASLPIAVASLVSSATDTPIVPLSEMAIELISGSPSELRVAEICAAVSPMAKPPTILSSVAWSARNVPAETTTDPLDAVIEAISLASATSADKPASTAPAVSEIASSTDPKFTFCSLRMAAASLVNC